MTVRSFMCNTCGHLLGKVDGTFLQTYCQHCRKVRLGIPDEVRQLRDVLRGASAVQASGAPSSQT